MSSYLFGSVTGSALTNEPALVAMLTVFVVTLLLGGGVWLLARNYHSANPLAEKQLKRLGGWLFWAGLIALGVAGSFYENVLLNKRFFMYLALLAIYAIVLYTVYFKFARYAELYREQQAERDRRRKYIPAPHTLGKGRSTAAERPPGGRRRRRTGR